MSEMAFTFNPSAIPAAMSIFGAVFGMDAGDQMEAIGREQARLAERNSLLEKRELREQVRRQAAEDQRLRSAALARGAASGAEISGSVALHLFNLEEEQNRQLNWLKTAGASRIRLNLESELLRAKATVIRGESQKLNAFFKGVTQAFAYMDQGGMFTEEEPA